MQASSSFHRRIRRIALGGVLSALAVVLAWLVRFPIFPAVPFLEYDAADIPIYLMTLLTDPLTGGLMTAATCIVQGITVSAESGWIGILMHLFATGSFVLTEGMLLFRRKRTAKRVILAMLAGTVTATVAMFCWNLLFTPIYTGMSRSAVLQLMPWILLFNVIKAGANSVLAALVYFGGRKEFDRLTLT